MEADRPNQQRSATGQMSSGVRFPPPHRTRPRCRPAGRRAHRRPVAEQDGPLAHPCVRTRPDASRRGPSPSNRPVSELSPPAHSVNQLPGPERHPAATAPPLTPTRPSGPEPGPRPTDERRSHPHLRPDRRRRHHRRHDPPPPQTPRRLRLARRADDGTGGGRPAALRRLPADRATRVLPPLRSRARRRGTYSLRRAGPAHDGPPRRHRIAVRRPRHRAATRGT
ncbi:hypothetical protein KCH_03630 [Kitasatospora cheerisanensis KCTC 2395]|uniref:Uncharacterized protein n=1 Tax=Kitasatospora cheerisanensis KCTC 2395 TaxID=1348663 RepID=A0A066ZBP2_9ACTN|nr:hypothetical protein KCH_03630 [Kitasatospora cheerisanensis KCTC 2395]